MGLKPLAFRRWTAVGPPLGPYARIHHNLSRRPRGPSMRVASSWGLVAALAAALCSHADAASCPAETTEALHVRGSTLCFQTDDTTASRVLLLRTWALRSANIVAAYYERFPAPLVVLSVRSAQGSGIGGGRTTNDSGLRIHVNVGREATSA